MTTDYQRFPLEALNDHLIDANNEEMCLDCEALGAFAPDGDSHLTDGRPSGRLADGTGGEGTRKKVATQMFAPFEVSSWPLRIILCIVFSPFVGLNWLRFGLKEKMAGNLVGHNNSDWLVVCAIGCLQQLSIIGPINVIKSPDYIRCVYPTDYFGALIFWPTSTLYLLAISLKYKLMYDQAAKLQSTHRFTTQAKVDTTKMLEKMREETNLPAWALIPFAMSSSVLWVWIIRLCLSCDQDKNLSRFSLRVGKGVCKEHDFTGYHGHSPDLTRGEDVDFMVMNAFWWLLTASITMSCSYALLIYLQLVRQIEAFAYIRRYSKKKTFLNDFTQFAKDMAVWAETWQDLIQAVNSRPIVRAFVSTNAVIIFFVFVGSAFYLTFQNVLSYSKVGELTTSTLVLVCFNAIMIFGFIVVTVRLQRAVEYQVKSISAQQNDLQRQIDRDKGTMDREKHMRMVSNLRVLASLDVYLSHYDNSPKLVGTINLESIRWIMVLGGLLAMNIFFFALYISRCYQVEKEDPDAAGGTGE